MTRAPWPGLRPAWVEVDLDAIAGNVRVLAAEVAPARLLAVVKADAYGHGAVPVARAARAGRGGLAGGGAGRGGAGAAASRDLGPAAGAVRAPPGRGRRLRGRPDRRDAVHAGRGRWLRHGRAPGRAAGGRPPQGRHRHAPPGLRPGRAAGAGRGGHGRAGAGGRGPLEPSSRSPTRPPRRPPPTPSWPGSGTPWPRRPRPGWSPAGATWPTAPGPPSAPTPASTWSGPGSRSTGWPPARSWPARSGPA